MKLFKKPLTLNQLLVILAVGGVLIALPIWYFVINFLGKLVG